MKLLLKMKSIFFRLLTNITDLVRKLFYSLEFFLFLRLILKFAGASSKSIIVELIYKWSDFLVSPFNLMFEDIYWPRDNLIEMATVVTMIGYAIIFFIFYKITESFLKIK